MKPTPRDRGNHPGICDFKGHSYVFGQNYDLMHLETFEHHERRSVSATEITYNADGTIQEVPYWLDQKPMNQLHWLNPYQRVEAETMNWGYGLKSSKMGIQKCLNPLASVICISTISTMVNISVCVVLTLEARAPSSLP